MERRQAVIVWPGYLFLIVILLLSLVTCGGPSVLLIVLVLVGVLMAIVVE